ncbi:MAG: carbohydrate porin [Phycisphaeraceae bacterium]
MSSLAASAAFAEHTGPDGTDPTEAGVLGRVADAGIAVDATLTVDVSRNLSGGRSGAGTFRHLFDLSIGLDLGPLVGVEGGSLLASFQTQEGQDGSAETGDLQAYSNIDADDFTALYELWYQQTLFDGVARIKVGKMDANADFAFVEHGGGFIHSSPGFSPTLFVLPTYPDPAFGAIGFVGEGGGLYAGAGVFDGALQEGVPTGTRGPKTLFGGPADLFVIGEVGYAWGGVEAADASPGRVAVGSWHHTGDFPRFDGGARSRATGAFLVFDQTLYRENPGAGDGQGLGAFFQYGWADPQLSLIEHHVGAGVQWVGALPGRDADTAGVMVSWAGLSDAPGAGLTDEAEAAVELFYELRLGEHLSLKPDLQYIANPGGAGLEDAWVATLRVELVF